MYLNDVLAFSKCTTRQRVYAKGLIIEEVNFLVFETLKHIMKDACEIQTIESYSDVQGILRGKIRLEISASLTSTGYFRGGKKSLQKGIFSCVSSV